ncbi:MAG: penicillin-binding transpeptidase domain-containing protein [Pseudomonadota bacterium]
MGRRTVGTWCTAVALVLISTAGNADEKCGSASLPSGVSATFVLKSLTNNTIKTLCGDADARHAPWSTFKIPNTLIALETGVLDPARSRREWDRKKHPARPFWPRAWRGAQTLRTAFKNSVVWYYRDLAEAVGTSRYRKHLTAFGYGNAEPGNAITAFWLGGPLALSPAEQSEFLDKLATGSLPVSSAHVTTLKDIAQVDKRGKFTVYGKSGSGPVKPGQFSGPFEGWYVGWLEADSRPTVAFAVYMKGPSFKSIRTLRQSIAFQLLEAEGYLPSKRL